MFGLWHVDTCNSESVLRSSRLGSVKGLLCKDRIRVHFPVYMEKATVFTALGRQRQKGKALVLIDQPN